MVDEITSLNSVSCQVIDALNTVILELQTGVRSASISTFHQQALAQVNTLVSFDKAWWGRSAWRDNWPVEHSSFLLSLSPDYPAEWEKLKTEDASLGKMHMNRGICEVIHCVAPDAPAALAGLGRRYDLSFALGIVLTDPHTQLGVHLTLFRSEGGEPFSPLEKRLVEWLMPHLIAAEQASYLRTLVTLRETQGACDETAMAVSDRYGVLLSMEPAFSSMLNPEWPDRPSNRLPGQVCPEKGYLSQNLQITAQPIDDLVLLTARRRSTLELLSQRELQVAQGFAVGQTYKEVARTIGVSPCTVRHHLRKIYNKLGVTRKAQITQLLHLTDG
ncbi:Regulatory protein, LuxR [Pseudomonas coronafaciens pv. atropurpurea]|uniref:response regulator transcription factor n=1 Tax=Pseudomonas coronafaciens TaxID=53409 RepID=UPI0006D610C4|nr:helix-turn-helix transcriptional regulator [Pseudomonas coronafaciens]KPW35777.1 Regulatory protein, LuxR [Pseudomonas coronafaciens pv. atropurpurea]RMT57120.1 Regulatory protein, LuxR [Pseudomonas coronafaciens pv. atropurpurea]